MQTRSSPNRQTLDQLAVRVGFVNHKNMPKTVLFDNLNKHFNMERLLRAEARNTKNDTKILRNLDLSSNSLPLGNRKRNLNDENGGEEQSAAAKKRISEGLNTIDPIMLIPIPKNQKTFKYERPNGSRVQFCVDSLVNYMLSSGDFTDPETRIAFTDEHLKQIDNLAIESNLNKASVLEAKHDENKFNDAKFRRDALLALERCAGEIVTDMLEIAETYDPDDGQMQLIMHEFPVFDDYFRQLRDAEPEYASKCLAQWRQFVTGPPNRPNRDIYGLIRLVSAFLRSFSEGYR